jgi:hypothetical protein
VGRYVSRERTSTGALSHAFQSDRRRDRMAPRIMARGQLGSELSFNNAQAIRLGIVFLRCGAFRISTLQ